jgi:hypothetical protein
MPPQLRDACAHAYAHHAAQQRDEHKDGTPITIGYDHQPPTRTQTEGQGGGAARRSRRSSATRWRRSCCLTASWTPPACW